MTQCQGCNDGIAKTQQQLAAEISAFFHSEIRVNDNMVTNMQSGGGCYTLQGDSDGAAGNSYSGMKIRHTVCALGMELLLVTKHWYDLMNLSWRYRT